MQFGREQYRKGLNIAQTQIKGLQEDVYELIRKYANGDPNVILHYSTPREDRLRKEQERQEAERKKREQEGKKKGLRLVEAPKQERTEEELRSRGFKR